MFRMHGRRALVVGAAALVLLGGLGAGEARAHRRDFPFTYEWFQAARNEKELELHTRYRERDKTWTHQVELEYGTTDRIQNALYLVFEDGPGESLQYTEFKLQGRYQLGDYKPNDLLPGLYLEYIRPKHGAGEIEAKLILSRYGTQGDNLSLNYIIEKELESGAEFENVYSVAYARTVGDQTRGTRVGAEWVHNLSDDRINAGPVLGMRTGASTWFTTHYLFPVNRRDGNKGEFRLIFGYEWH